MKLPSFLTIDPDASWKSVGYSVAVFCCGLSVAILRANAPNLGSGLVPFIFFALTAMVAELLLVHLPKGGTVSVGFAAHLACVMVVGPHGAALTSALGLTIGDIIKRKPTLERVLFNFGQVFIATDAAAHVYVLAGGPILSPNLLRTIVPALLATLAYFAVNAAAVTVAISISNGHRFIRVWSANVRWGLPNFAALAPLGILVGNLYSTTGVVGSILLFLPLFLARYSFQQYIAMKEAHLGVVQALAAALEAKDPYTKGHSDRVAEYASELVAELGYPYDLSETIRLSAQMHDIGKIGVSEGLLNKPSSLSEDELNQVRQHAFIGSKILQGIGFLSEVASNIEYHHEWYDGTFGYPHLKAGNEIPLGARILMVCDSFDAMTSDRPYRNRMSVDEAVRRLKKGAGTQFDPEIVTAFVTVLRRRGLLDDTSN